MYTVYNRAMPISPGNRTTKCRNCPERFPWKRGKKFCSTRCKDEFHNAGGTPTKALEQRIFKLLKSDRFREILRSEIRALQSANGGKSQPVESVEKSTKTSTYSMSQHGGNV
jgi:hypothetical protein